MMQVWKFALKDRAGMHTVRLPLGCKILTIDYQDGLPYVWALVDPDDAPGEMWRIGYFGTGWDMADIRDHYVCTRQVGPYVWHWFAMKDE